MPRQKPWHLQTAETNFERCYHHYKFLHDSEKDYLSRLIFNNLTKLTKILTKKFNEVETLIQ